MYGSGAKKGLSRPFVLWQEPGHMRESDPTWETFLSKLTGYKRNPQLNGTKHLTFGDDTLLSDLYPFKDKEAFGTIDGLRAVQIFAAYARDFFAFVLEGACQGLLSGPSKKYPEVTFIP
jgi:hypothetical protein